MYAKKITSFCQVLKKMHTKENWFLFSASPCRGLWPSDEESEMHRATAAAPIIWTRQRTTRSN